MSKHTVDVSGQCYAVRVYQYADNIWIADGEFFGHQLRSKRKHCEKSGDRLAERSCRQAPH
jgi:hypothetical protein